MFILMGADTDSVATWKVTFIPSPRTVKLKRSRTQPYRERYAGAALIAFAAFTSKAIAVAFIHHSYHHHRYFSTSQKHPCFSHGRILYTNENNCRLHVHEGVDVDGIHPLSKLRQTSYDALLKRIDPSVQIVLIGEGTHGTEEFFRIRSEVTQCLLYNHGFNAIMCEGDVQPFFGLNKFVTTDVQGSPTDADKIRCTKNEWDDTNKDIRSMLSQLFCHRFPEWMWSNMPMADLISRLKTFNSKAQQKDLPVQIFGMDIQSPFDSMDYVVQKLSEIGEEELAISIKGCYETMSVYQDNIRNYGNDVYGNKVVSQEKNVNNALEALLQKYETKNTLHSEGRFVDVKELKIWFQMIQNAHAIVASEAYHRQRIYPGHTTTWNIRTKSMLDSISQSMEYIDELNRITSAVAACKENKAPPVRLVVWAHNSHVGDMRSTGYSSLGQISLGQLCRETFGEDNVFLIGMTTYEGTVRAAYADRQGACWKGNGEVMALKKAMDDSHESVLHSIATTVESVCGEKAFGLDLQLMRQNEKNEEVTFNCNRAERFVGSCYLPQTERMSHYTQCNMVTQFDYIFHVDESSAITA